MLVVRVSAGRIVAMPVGMAEGLVAVPVPMIFLQQNGDAEDHQG